MFAPLFLLIISLSIFAQPAPTDPNYQYSDHYQYDDNYQFGQTLQPDQFYIQDPKQKQEEQSFREKLLQLEQDKLTESQKQTALINEQDDRIEAQEKTIEDLNNTVEEQRNEMDDLQDKLDNLEFLRSKNNSLKTR